MDQSSKVEDEDRLISQECLVAIEEQRRLALLLGMPSCNICRTESFEEDCPYESNPESWIKRAWQGYSTSVGIKRRPSRDQLDNRDILNSLKRMPTETSLNKIVAAFNTVTSTIVRLIIKSDRRVNDYAINESLFDTRILSDWITWFITLRQAFSPRILADVCRSSKANPASLGSLFDSEVKHMRLSCLAVWDCMPIKLYNQPRKLIAIRDSLCLRFLDSLSFLIQNLSKNKAFFMLLSNNSINSLLVHCTDILPDARYLDSKMNDDDTTSSAPILVANMREQELYYTSFCGRCDHDLVSSMVSFCKSLASRIDTSSIPLLIESRNYAHAFFLLKSIFLFIDHPDQIIASHCRNALLHLVVVARNTLLTPDNNRFKAYKTLVDILSIPIDDGTASCSLFDALVNATRQRISEFDIAVMNSGPECLLDGNLSSTSKMPTVSARSISMEDHYIEESHNEIAMKEPHEDRNGWVETPRRPIMRTADTTACCWNGQGDLDRTCDFLEFIGELYSNLELHHATEETDLTRMLAFGKTYVTGCLQDLVATSLCQIIDETHNPSLDVVHGCHIEVPDMRSPQALNELDIHQAKQGCCPISPLTVVKVISVMLKSFPLCLTKPLIDLIFISNGSLCGFNEADMLEPFKSEEDSTSERMRRIYNDYLAHSPNTTLLTTILTLPFLKTSSPVISLLVGIAYNAHVGLTKQLESLWEQGLENACYRWNDALSGAKGLLMEYCAMLSHKVVRLCNDMTKLTQINSIRGWLMFSSYYFRNLCDKAVTPGQDEAIVGKVRHGLEKMRGIILEACQSAHDNLTEWIMLSESLQPLGAETLLSDGPLSLWDMELWQNLVWIFLEEARTAKTCGQLQANHIVEFTEPLDLMVSGHSVLGSSYSEFLVKHSWNRYPRKCTSYCQDISAFHWKWAPPTGFKRKERVRQHVRFLVHCLELYKMYVASLDHDLKRLNNQGKDPPRTLLKPSKPPTNIYDIMGLEDCDGNLTYSSCVPMVRTDDAFTPRALVYYKPDHVRYVSHCDTVLVDVDIHDGRLVLTPVVVPVHDKSSPSNSKAIRFDHASSPTRGVPSEPIEIPLECISLNLNEQSVPKERVASQLKGKLKMVQLDICYSVVKLQDNVSNVLLALRNHIPNIRLSQLPTNVSRRSDYNELQPDRGTVKLIIDEIGLQYLRKVLVDKSHARLQSLCLPIFAHLKDFGRCKDIDTLSSADEFNAATVIPT